ncbi:MAG TPA: mechanosensitive ion channel domain-containing protein [Galbitalea sp.]|nr:mechanosensitive ion channel domain-containing protein [Galbitalea sp.]
MFDFVSQPWFVPAIVVVVGLPIVMILLTELHGTLVRNGAHGTRFVLLLRNFVAPTGALLLLLAQTADVGSPSVNWVRIVATIFGFLVILALLGGLNLVIFETAKTGSWRSRVPSIFIEVVRVILIVVCLGVLFSVVWHADVGGLFAALGVGSIVIGLALQNAVGGVVSGLLLLSERPLEIDEWIVVDGVRGQVKEINWRSVHMMTVNGLLIVPNSSLAGSTFLNITKGDGPFTNDIYVRFALEDPPQDVMAVCDQTAAGLPMIYPGQSTTVSTLGKGRFEVEIPITSPALNGASIRMFNTRLWYAARRAGLHLDREWGDPYQTPERLVEAVQTFAGALYLSTADIQPLSGAVSIERYSEGEVVQQPMSVPDAMRYILSGTASLTYPADGGDIVIETLAHASVLGLTALTRQPVVTTAVALTELAVLRVPVAVLDDLVTTRPDLARDIGVELDHRRELAEAALKAVGVEEPADSSMIA